MMKLPGKSGNRYFVSILFFAGLMPSLFSAFLLYKFSEWIGGDQVGYVHSYFFFLVSILLMAFALTPSTLVAAVAGYYFSWTGFPGAVISYLIASTVGLKLGKILKNAGIAYVPVEGSKWKRLLNQFERSPLLLVFFARLSPALPFAMTNIALSTMNISWKNYLWGSLLGMLPRTFLFFWIGKNSKAIWETVRDPLKEGNFVWIIVLFFVVSAMGIFYLVRKKS